jgi:hypothetical protein
MNKKIKKRYLLQHDSGLIEKGDWLEKYLCTEILEDKKNEMIGETFYVVDTKNENVTIEKKREKKIYIDMEIEKEISKSVEYCQNSILSFFGGVLEGEPALFLREGYAVDGSFYEQYYLVETGSNREDIIKEFGININELKKYE